MIIIKTLKEIIENNDLNLEDFIFYGNNIAKINNYLDKEKRGKLVLVTSTSPTKYGEGKTTLAISLNDSLNSLNYKSIVALREPSLGPVFGTKGGANGGGCAKIVPEMPINLHFTGDIHAITTANNLLSAIIDNHIFQGNSLLIKDIKHERCIDLNDRSLRNVSINGTLTKFNISTASEMMAILCLSRDREDLREKLGNILVGYNNDKKEIFVRDLNCVNALMLLLEDAIKPNVVKTLEDNLALVHGGPFANIAHGTSSIVSTRYALNHFDYTVVEAGFGSDMGALKYFDIVARQNKDLIPDVTVLNTTIQSLKYNGNNDLKKGISNLEYHIDNMLRFTNNLIVVLNKHESDKDEDIKYIEDYVIRRGLAFSLSTGYLNGSSGSLDAAKKIVELAKTKDKELNLSYELYDDLKLKISKFCKKNFGVHNIVYSDDALKSLELINKGKFKDLPICIAKTQYSITPHKDVLGYPKDFDITIKDIKLFSGAGFITIYLGNILTMPGLSSDANYLHM